MGTICRAAGRAVAPLAVAAALAGCVAPAAEERLIDRAAGAFAAGDSEAAEAALTEALRLDPDDGVALLSLGALYERTDRAEEAKRLYREVIARFGPAEAATLGVGSTARSAFAALARIRLARLEGGVSEGALTPEMVRKVFGNLAKVSADLEALSERLRVAAEAPAGAAAAKKEEAAAATTEEEAPAAAETPASPSEPAVAAAPATPPVRVHLASYRSAKQAEVGWKRLRERYPDLLGRLGHDTVRIDLGPGMGVYYRLVAGPLAGEPAARALCRALKRQGAFCALLFG